MTPPPGVPVQPTIRVLLVDDHRMFTQALQGLLAGESGIEPAGVAASVDEALAQLDDARPDVVLMDVDLPGTSGIEGTREIRRRRSETAVVIVTSHDDPALVTGAIRAGACGYVLKTRAVDELVSIIRQAAAGGMVLSPANVPEAIGEVRISGAVRRRSIDDGHRLTDREMDVLRELASGRTTDQIADSLYISVLTVRSHVKSILAKLGVHSKLEAVTYALGHGLVEVSRPA